MGSELIVPAGMQYSRIRFLFLNVGHFLDHFFLLIFAAAAALRLTIEWDMSYAALIPYATPSFVAFAVCSIPARDGSRTTGAAKA